VIRIDGAPRVWVWSDPVDFRKGMNGLSALVAQALKADPYSGDVFIFRAKRADRLKCLVWDHSGMVLATKWLEAGKFSWPPVRNGAVRLSPTQFSLLVEGLEWERASPRAVRRPVCVS
jgi:transposase